MTARTYRVTIDDERTISAAAMVPREFRRDGTPAVVLAHGAGTSMAHPFMVGAQEGLAAAGCLVVTFNFPYAERGRWPPDPRPVLESTYRSVLRWLESHRTLRPGSVVIGGRSLGGRIASHVAATGAEVRGLLYLAYPLHPPGQPTRLRAAHLSAIERPMLFVCGTRDALCDLTRLRAIVDALAPRAAVHTVEGADHSFRVPKRLGRTDADVLAEIVRVSAGWVHSLEDR
jgi:predicted alpha/beta-hydrolase family hydrolase